VAGRAGLLMLDQSVPAPAQRVIQAIVTPDDFRVDRRRRAI
jgi:hypothetical protein